MCIRDRDRRLNFIECLVCCAYCLNSLLLWYIFVEARYVHWNKYSVRWDFRFLYEVNEVGSIFTRITGTISFPLYFKCILEQNHSVPPSRSTCELTAPRSESKRPSASCYVVYSPQCKAYIWLVFAVARIFQLTLKYIDEKMFVMLILFNLFFHNKITPVLTRRILFFFFFFIDQKLLTMQYSFQLLVVVFILYTE